MKIKRFLIAYRLQMTFFSFAKRLFILLEHVAIWI
jgi:hypothetical protein